VVPIPSIYARPNRKYFGSDRGVTWLNMINDQAAGLAGKVVSGTPRDSLHMIDVAFSQDQGQRPDIIVADTGSYSDLVFGLCHLLGREYRPALVGLPETFDPKLGTRTQSQSRIGPAERVERSREGH
jgi:TnpA family transposase